MTPKSAPASTQATKLNAVESLWKAYNDNTPNRLKFIDSFLLFLMLSGIVQFVYCILVSSFPYNAFLAGLVSIFYDDVDLILCSFTALEVLSDSSC